MGLYSCKSFLSPPTVSRTDTVTIISREPSFKGEYENNKLKCLFDFQRLDTKCDPQYESQWYAGTKEGNCGFEILSHWSCRPILIFIDFKYLPSYLFSDTAVHSFVISKSQHLHKSFKRRVNLCKQNYFECRAIQADVLPHGLLITLSWRHTSPPLPQDWRAVYCFNIEK